MKDRAIHSFLTYADLQFGVDRDIFSCVAPVWVWRSEDAPTAHVMLREELLA